jgi:hypothetical protein
MAAPTDVRVEAESLTTTRVRWTYPGTSTINVYRSTDGASYSSVAFVAVGTTEYEDTGLTAATKYWYKLSDDVGSTFSSVVTVYTHACGVDANGKGTEITLPRETEENVSAETFNSLATVVEQGLVKFVAPDGRTCVACISDGALVLDCIDFDGCNSIEVVVDQDINSISLPNCADKEVDVNFIIPPSVTRKIGGWPRGIGFTGDEGFRAPIAGGASGRIINEYLSRALNTNARSGKSKSGTNTEGTNQGGAANSTGSCTCTPASDGGMRIVACTLAGAPNTRNSLGCANATQGVKLLVCGGRGPFTWSNTGSVTRSGSSGTSITVSPPANSGSAVAGAAYKVANKYTASAGGFCENWVAWRTFGCNDAETACDTAADGVGFFPCGAFVNLASLSCVQPSCCNSACAGAVQCPSVGCNACACATLAASGSVCDTRTAGMISNNCAPCGVRSGDTVSVTDATGAVVTIVLTA